MTLKTDLNFCLMTTLKAAALALACATAPAFAGGGFTTLSSQLSVDEVTNNLTSAVKAAKGQMPDG